MWAPALFAYKLGGVPEVFALPLCILAGRRPVCQNVTWVGCRDVGTCFIDMYIGWGAGVWAAT